MMTTQGNRSWMRAQRLSIAAHTFTYGLVWLFTFAETVGTSYSSIPNGWYAIMLLWSLVYTVHVANFVAANGRIRSSGDDRQAYREGFRDGSREAMALQSEGRLDRERLTVDDDGELAELMEEDKRKRR